MRKLELNYDNVCPLISVSITDATNGEEIASAGYITDIDDRHLTKMLRDSMVPPGIKEQLDNLIKKAPRHCCIVGTYEADLEKRIGYYEV